MVLQIEIDDCVALTLFEFLSRTLDDQNGEKLHDVVVHDGELWALNMLHLFLEKEMIDPFASNYQANVEKAHELLVVKFGAWPKR